MPQFNNVNDARYPIFSKTYQVKDATEHFAKKLKNYNVISLPPSKAELHRQLLRTQYIGILWSVAYIQTLTLIPTLLQSQENCSVEQDQKLELLWFDLSVLVNGVMTQPTSAEWANMKKVHAYK